VAQEVTLVTFTLKVLGSNVGQGIKAFLIDVFLGFPHSLKTNSGIDFQIRP
jgi:hypothetical protein